MLIGVGVEVCGAIGCCAPLPPFPTSCAISELSDESRLNKPLKSGPEPEPPPVESEGVSPAPVSAACGVEDVPALEVAFLFL